MSTDYFPLTPKRDRKFIAAVQRLVDAVLTEHCISTEAHHLDEEHTVNCVLAVLREICATAELSSLHTWAKKRLDAHAGDEDMWEGLVIDPKRGPMLDGPTPDDD